MDALNGARHLAEEVTFGGTLGTSRVTARANAADRARQTATLVPPSAVRAAHERLVSWLDNVVVRRTDAGYSRLLAEPFGRALALPVMPAAATKPRIPVGVAHELLARAVDASGDPAIGLRAARRVQHGDGGALDYAMQSASNVGDALATAARFIRLLNGDLSMSLESARGRVHVRFDPRVASPAVAEDFMMCAIYKVHLQRILPRGVRLECWFSQPKPKSRRAHEQVFRGARLRFSAPHAGFVFDDALLARPLAGADAKLHGILVRYLERDLAELPDSLSFTERAQKLLLHELPLRDATLTRAAEAMRLSSRTLARRLEAEGTSFGALLDEVRRTRAALYLEEGSLRVEEIAVLLGFSKGTAFHRAWKRWTGMTPRQYAAEREARGEAESALKRPTR